MTQDGHPSPSLVARYAAGELPLAPALVVAAHLHACPRCRARVGRLEEAEGLLMASLPDAPLAPGALERTLARLGEGRPEPRRRRPAWSDAAALPAPVAQLGLSRRRFLTPDFWVAQIPAARKDGWRCYVLRAPAGRRIPTHEHRGVELVCVLTGAFADGRVHRAGDFSQNPAGGRHDVQITADGPCVCLIAAQGRAAWKGFARPLATYLDV